MKANKAERPLPEPEGEPVPVITVISETERIFAYPDGLTVLEKQNRPNGPADCQWALDVVSTLAPQLQLKSKKEINNANDHAA